MLTFSWWPVFLLLPLPFVLRRLLPKHQSSADAALKAPFYPVISAMVNTQESATHSQWRLALLSLIWILTLTAASRPVWMGNPLTLPSSGRDLMLAVDVSQSMETPDFSLNGQQTDRLTAVKAVVSEFIDRREHDRIGLVLFGAQAYLQTPLTFDRATVKQLLSEALIGIAGPQTAIGDGIALALKRLREHASASRVLILLTDGANTAGKINPLQAAELAQSEGLKIYTIGVGADELFVPGPFGFGARRINPSQDLDESTLKQIAEMTQGQYFRAKDTDKLEQIYQLLDKLEPIEVDQKTVRPRKALFYWPLGLAFILSFALMFKRL